MHKTGKIVVLPIILKPCAWKDAPFAKFQVLPTDGVPIVSSKWHSRDEPFLEIVEVLKTKTEQIRLGKLLEDPEKAFEYYVNRGDDYFLDMDWQSSRKYYRKALQNWSNGYMPNREDLREKIDFCNDALELPLLKKVDLRDIHIVAFQDEESQLWGFGNPKNHKILIPPQFEEVITWDGNGVREKGMDNGLACVRKGGKVGVIDIISNEVVPFEYDDAFDLIFNLAILKKGDKWGAFDRFGKKTIPFDYDGLSECGLFVFAEKNGKTGLLTLSGRQLIPFEYDSILAGDGDFFVEGLAGAEKNGKWGFITEKNEVVIPFMYKSVRAFSEGLACAENFDGLWGFINVRNEDLIEFKFDDVWNFSNGMAKVKIAEHWGMIDKSGQKILKCQFEEIGWGFSESFIPVKMNGLWGAVSQGGIKVVDFQYDDMHREFEGLVPTKKNGSWGYLDLKGNVVVPFVYSWVYRFQNGKAEVKEHDGEIYYINKQGETVEPPESY